MCICDPNIRTPYCGRGDCISPEERRKRNTRAWSDGKDHVIISINGQELGMDLIIATQLYKQLGDAIKKAI